MAKKLKTNKPSNLGYGIKTTLTLLLLALGIITGILMYRNVFLKAQTEESISVLVDACSGGVLRDYHNTIGVKSIEDVKYNYDEFLQVYRIYFGNYTIYVSDMENDSWTAEGLRKYLNSIGITYGRVDNRTVFYYQGVEIVTDEW